jgi:lactoylglutathione lyase
MSIARLRYVILYVEDVERAFSFYRDAFGLSEKARHGDYLELDTGATVLALAARRFAREQLELELAAPGLGSSEIGLVVERADLAAVYDQAIGHGATAVSPPHEQPWGQLVSYVRDPDGHLLEICSPVP